MIEHFPFILLMLVVIVLLIMLANKIKVAYPVLLVLAGLLISILPGVPHLRIEPELIFVIFLPPLLYEAAFAISWKELWRWRRIVSSFAFLVVFLTATSVALVANACIPGISLALGFLLGGIVSPPDAVSANAILKFVQLPRRITSILEGESLMNDASSLIIFRFALIAVATGQFVWYQAALSFVWMVAGGIAVGLLTGWLFIKMHRLLPTDANVDIVLTLVTPYAMYIAAEAVHSSGVMAVVSGGLLLSNKRNYFLSSTARVKGYNVWQSFVFLLNGLVFLLIGLDLPEITEALKQEGIAMHQAIGYGLLVTAVLIVVRIICSFGAVLVTKIASHFITVADKNPGLKAPVIISWTGMRGVVSLAAALSIPVQLADGSLFPHRPLILFITFVVILTTLVVQGLTLPWLIRKIKMPDYGDYMPEAAAELMLTKELASFTLNYINSSYAEQIAHNASLRLITIHAEHQLHQTHDAAITPATKKMQLDILEQQRLWLQQKNKTNTAIDEEVIRKMLYSIDLEEEQLKYH